MRIMEKRYISYASPSSGHTQTADVAIKIILSLSSPGCYILALGCGMTQKIRHASILPFERQQSFMP